MMTLSQLQVAEARRRLKLLGMTGFPILGLVNDPICDFLTSPLLSSLMTFVYTG